MIPVGAASVARIFDEGLARYPERECLSDRSYRFTWAELDDRVARAATVLRDTGVRRGDRVACWLPNTTEIVVAFLAVMRIGGMWVGINRLLAPAEKAFIIRDSGSCLAIAAAESVDAIRQQGVAIRWITAAGPAGQFAALIDAADPDPSHPDIDPHAPAAIAYSSGTTGFPKGAVHSQHNMMLFGAARRFQGHNPADQRWGVVKPLGLLNLMISGPVQTINSGCPLVVIDRVDPVGLAAWLHDFRVDLIHIAPPTLRDLLTHPDVRPEQIDGTELWVGGASCPPQLVEMYRARFGRAPDQGYGLTEAPCGVTTTYGLDGAPPDSVGKPLPHVEITIRGEDGAELPVGQQGEVCVGAVASGPWRGVYTPMIEYWNQPEATKTALADGVLRTGDIGVLDPDGYLFIIDRKSEMIIRGGYNVYPAEVERVIRTVPGVADCVVVPRSDERMGEVPVALVEPAQPAGPGGAAGIDAGSVLAACRGQLARYKVPQEVIMVAELPRTAMQKVDRATARRLAAPVTEREGF